MILTGCTYAWNQASKPRASGDDPVALWGELLKDL